MCQAGTIATRDWQAVREALDAGETRRPGLLELFHVLSTRDAVTARHCVRVAEYCMKVAPVLGLTAEERQTLFVAARLHDIGKLCLSPALLQKPGPLTPAEWAVVREHPQNGESIGAYAAIAPEICLIIRHHHERWNGRGYPDGVRGHQIPRLARVLAAADAFDAMTHGRPYRLACTIESAMTELQAVSGTQLDPAVVAAFVTVPVEVFQEVCRRHPGDPSAEFPPVLPVLRKTGTAGGHSHGAR